MAYDDHPGEFDEITNSPEYLDLVENASREVISSEARGVAANEEDFMLTPAKLEDYLKWRAMEKTWREAASLSRIDLATARTIEEAEDFIDKLARQRSKIVNDPGTEILSMLPHALGVLREKVADGNPMAIKMVLEVSSSISKERLKADKDGKVDGETRRAAPSASDKETIERVGRQLVDGARKPTK